MSPKVSQGYIDGKRQAILQSAASVFIRNGFTGTTMQDIVDECGISRGGLYLFFSSTQEIFMALLEGDLGAEEDALAQFTATGCSGLAILQAFVEEQRKSILDISNTLLPASYEFFIKLKDDPDVRALLTKRRGAARNLLERAIEYGIGRREFTASATSGLADFIVNFIEGLILSAISTGPDEETLRGQMGLLMEFIQGKLC